MEVSYNIIIDYLQPILSDEYRFQAGDKCFDQVRILPDDNVPVTAEHLYYTDADTLRNSRHRHNSHLYILFIDEDIFDYSGCAFHPIPIAAGSVYSDVLNRLLTMFDRMNKWECNMERAISGKFPLQKLVDISTDLLQKPFFIFDYGLNTLAGNHCSNGDPIVKTILESKGLPEEYIHFLLDNNYFNEIKSFTGPGLMTLQLIKPYNLLVQPYSANLLTVDSIALLFGDEVPSPAEQDYLRYFAQSLERYINTHYRTQDRPVVNIQSFYGDCLEGRIGSPEEIQKRAGLLKVPYSGHFSVSYVYFDQFSYSSALYLVEEMRSSNPFATVFIHDQGVVVINDEQKFLNSEADTENIESRSNDYLKKHHARVGISGLCDNLASLHSRYIQAKASIELGMLLDPDKYRYRYRDYFFYHVIYSAGKTLDINTLYAPRLKPLIKYDQEHHTNNLELLEVYLASEYNVTETAKKMNLHRNSVIYRLDKIKTLLGESLDNPSFRANLILSFHTLRLLDAIARGNDT